MDNDSEMNNNKREYKSDKEYVLYIPKTENNEKDGFLDVMNDPVGIVDRISKASRLTSVEANRAAVKFVETNNLIPFKMKICDYKNYTFLNA